MTASFEPDAAQVEAERARTLLELAGGHVRASLAFPGEIHALRGIVAELLFENAAIRWQHDQLQARVERLERRNGGG